jgi:hypothetical protein
VRRAAPSLSQQIRVLERELRVTLFTRTSRGRRADAWRPGLGGLGAGDFLRGRPRRRGRAIGGQCGANAGELRVCTMAERVFDGIVLGPVVSRLPIRAVSAMSLVRSRPLTIIAVIAATPVRLAELGFDGSAESRSGGQCAAHHGPGRGGELLELQPQSLQRRSSRARHNLASSRLQTSTARPRVIVCPELPPSAQIGGSARTLLSLTSRVRARPRRRKSAERPICLHRWIIGISADTAAPRTAVGWTSARASPPPPGRPDDRDE